MSDELKEKLDMSLRISAKKISVEIVEKTKRKNEIKVELDKLDNEKTKLEAAVEVYREKRDDIQKKAKEMNNDKSELYDEKDRLVHDRRSLTSGFYNDMPKNARDELNQQVADKSKEIDEIFEKINEMKEEVQSMYDAGQEAHEEMRRNNDMLYKLKRDEENIELNFKKEYTTLNNELSQLRRKMNNIQNKLDDN